MPSWWDGHPQVGEKVFDRKAIHVGSIQAFGCNLSKDVTCASLETGVPTKIFGVAELIALALVTLTVTREGSRLVISVADEGPGFPEEFLPHAFERFRRADTARARSEGGSGLGLAIAETIARAHGGRARATNRPGGGAVVEIELPAPAASAADERPSLASPR